MKDEPIAKTLLEFLESRCLEVEGRDSAIPDQVIQKLDDFLSGKLSNESRQEFLRVLAENPQWIGSLAEKIKSQRIQSSSM